jgi:hypothetical protein
MAKSTKEMVQEIHDFTIRMEPYCKDVEQLKKTVYGNGKMGLRTQVIILWGAFSILGAIVIRAAAK